MDYIGVFRPRTGQWFLSTANATYTVANTTATPTVLRYKDGHGKTITETVGLVSPLVGQLQTDLPSSYTNVTTPRADLAAHPATRLIFTSREALPAPFNHAQRGIRLGTLDRNDAIDLVSQLSELFSVLAE